MKTIYNLLISFSILSLCVLTGCSNKADVDDPSEVPSIYGKWEVTDANNPFVSFEFNKDGNYIIVAHINAVTPKLKSITDNEKVYFGTYTFQDDKTIMIGNSIKIEIISLTSASFEFRMTVIEGSDSVNTVFSTVKAKNTIEFSDRTELFCRTWILKRVNGIDISTSITSTVLISRAGTYYTLNSGQGQLSAWKWYDYPGMGKETVFAYSHDNWQSSGMATIITLTENSLTLADGAGYMYEYEVKN